MLVAFRKEDAISDDATQLRGYKWGFRKIVYFGHQDLTQGLWVGHDDSLQVAHDVVPQNAFVRQSLDPFFELLVWSLQKEGVCIPT